MTEGYPLATLLALRERAEEAARAALAEALSAEDRARCTRNRLRTDREAVERSALAEAGRNAEDATAAALQGRAEYQTRLRREEAGAIGALSNAGRRVAAARAALTVASSAREEIARHHASWEEARRRRHEREEDAAGDDLAAALGRARGGES